MERDSRLYKLRRKLQVFASSFLSAEFLSRIYYYIVLKKKLRLKNPVTFNEKLQWLKLNYYPRNVLVVNCADKVKVRDYVKNKGFEFLLTQIYGIYKNTDEINWNGLPNQFVLKCNHGCAYNILCPNKDNFDKVSATKQLSKWLNEDFGKFNQEIHYSQIKERRILCEEYLGDCITDYKFFCFHGKPKVMYVSNDLIHDRKAKIGFFNLDGSKYPLIRDDYANLENIVLPPFYNEMVCTAKLLSDNFPFVRVDFFITDNRYYFSELTFTPAGCMMPFNPEKYDYEWGKLIDLSKILMKRSK